MKVLKYRLHLVDTQEIDLPVNAHVVHVGELNGELCFWAEMKETLLTHALRTFHVVSTGKYVPSEEGLRWNYRGTAVMASGRAWHVYEEI